MAYGAAYVRELVVLDQGLSTVTGVHPTFKNVVEEVGVDVAESMTYQPESYANDQRYLRGTETQGWSA